MTVEVIISAKAELPHALTEELLADLITFTLTAEQALGDWEFSVAFVDEARIIDLHQRFMGIDEPTDILTFPYDEPAQLGAGGDIAICVPVAATQARDHDISLERELCFLVVHGVLHLLDHDDRTDEMRGAMLSRQDQILDEWGEVSR